MKTTCCVPALIKSPWAALPFALLLAVQLQTAHADILVDNLAQPASATSDLPSDLWAAQSFATAADPVLLLSIELPLGLAVGGPNVIAELHADAGPQQVGATLTSFVVPALSTGALQLELLPSVPELTLAAGTVYWVVLGVIGEGSFGWSYAENNLNAGPGSLANYAYSTDAGASWLNYGNERPYFLRVNVSPVPEPASAAMFAGGLLALISLARRRRPDATQAGL